MPEFSRTRRASRVSLRRRMLSAAVAAAGLVAAMLVPVVATDAAWNDPEWVNGAIGTLDCSVTEGLTSQGTGRVLSGSLVGESLDPVAGLSGIVVANDGATSSAQPAGSTPLGADAYVSPIALQALGGLISADLGLTLPLDAGVGSYAQYGQALPDGASTGAAGAVTDQGTIDLDAVQAGTAPSMGTFQLSQLPGIGPALGGIADLTLGVGAVASSTTVDGCEERWSGPAAAVQRDYLVSGLDLGFESPAGAALSATADTAVGTLLTGVNTTVSAAETALGNAVVAGLGPLLTGLINNALLSLGTVTIDSVDIAVDATPLQALLDAPLTDGVVSVDLTAGTVTVDLATLVGEVHESSDGLNGLAPNTSVLSSEVLTALVDRVGLLLRNPATQTGLLYDLERAAAKMVLDASVSIEVSAIIRAQLAIVTVNAVDVGVTIDGTVGGLLGEDGYAAPDIDVTAEALNTGILGALLAPVNALVAIILSSLEGLIVENLLPTLAGVLQNSLVAPATGLIGTMTTTLFGAVTTALGALDGELDLISQLVSVTVNSQPDQPPQPAPPYPVADGEYAVSALRIGVVDGTTAGAASVLNVFLASSTAGPNAF
ncbi:choice-of-anchor G family protein [Microbacterium sp. CFH 90308]|uniref:Choice-of-anchor G family protein n=1 Tax=Microbacterium salsuginis TaxID=2722803 RepID=A0ABX1KB95_9MICO|nr:choice-of-anchor G family protein [Microbacterium sp. CFH 90308]NLP84302.1 choice-of-anchor G family protein [Microbacterium sp. CFH 90308]